MTNKSLAIEHLLGKFLNNNKCTYFLILIKGFWSFMTSLLKYCKCIFFKGYVPKLSTKLEAKPLKIRQVF